MPRSSYFAFSILHEIDNGRKHASEKNTGPPRRVSGASMSYSSNKEHGGLPFFSGGARMTSMWSFPVVWVEEGEDCVLSRSPDPLVAPEATLPNPDDSFSSCYFARLLFFPLLAGDCT